MVRAVEDVRRIRTERVPPHNLEAEESVLGSMMLSSEAIAEVIETVEPEDFYRSAHQKIYRALTSIYARGEPVDAITAVEELKRSKLLEDVGGPLAIHALVEQVATPASAQYHARIVADLALLRRLLAAAADIMEIAYTNPDDLLSGLQPANLILLAARPSVGKSALALNIARNITVNARKPVALFSLEMSRWEIGMRLLCSEAGVPMAKVRAGRVGPGDWASFVDAANVLHDAPMYIVDAGDSTILDIRAKSRRLKSKGGLSLVIVDYLQLMGHYRRVDNRQQEIAEISRSLKLLAKELDVPVLALSQLNRNPEMRSGGRPQLSDLRESGSLEQDADVVMFIHREKDPDGNWVKGTAELVVAKHRNGPTGNVTLTFAEDLIQFRNHFRGQPPG